MPARVADDPTFEPIWRAFRQGLATFGWTEVRNLQIDYRISDFDPSRLAADAEELVNLRPDVMFAFIGQVARAVQQHRLTRVADVYFANEEVNRDELRATIRAAAAQLEVTMIRMPVRDEVEIEHAITALAAEPDGSLLLNEANPLPIVEAIKRLASYVRQWSLPRKNLEPLRGVSMHSQSWHNIHEADFADCLW